MNGSRCGPAIATSTTGGAIATKTGFLKVYVNGGLKVAHKGRTMTTDMIYFRYGVYRSFISRYRSNGADEIIPTQAAYFANVMKAEARDALK